VALDRLINSSPSPQLVAPLPLEAPALVEAPPPKADAPAVTNGAAPSAPEPVRAVVKPKLAPVAQPVDVKDAQVEPPPSVPPDESLRSERLLIDAARAALARDPQAARAPLKEHATRFPQGQFWEEREALMIQAFVLANDAPAAHQRLETFSRVFPASPLLRALKMAVDGLE
jgi:hypothetical protein